MKWTEVAVQNHPLGGCVYIEITEQAQNIKVALLFHNSKIVSSVLKLPKHMYCITLLLSMYCTKLRHFRQSVSFHSQSEVQTMNRQNPTTSSKQTGCLETHTVVLASANQSLLNQLRWKFIQRGSRTSYTYCICTSVMVTSPAAGHTIVGESLESTTVTHTVTRSCNNSRQCKYTFCYLSKGKLYSSTTH